MLTITQGIYRVQLPEIENLGFNPEVASSERMMVAGNIITQTSALHESTASIQYDGLIDRADAERLSAMKIVSSNVDVEHDNKKYAAVFYLQRYRKNEAKSRVVIKIRVVREY